MINGKLWLLTLTLIAYIKGSTAPVACTYVAPTYIWPLGQMLQVEILNDVAGTEYQTSLDVNTPLLDYNATRFDATLESYVQLPIPVLPLPNRDFAFQLFFFAETDGVILHYQSDTGSSTLITSIALKLINNELYITLSNDVTSQTLAAGITSVSYNTWHRIGVGHDQSRDVIFVVLDGTVKELTFGGWMDMKETVAPGTVSVGGSVALDSYFTGKVACLQLMECREPEGDPQYDDDCKIAMWPYIPTPGYVSQLQPATPPYKPLATCSNAK